jgi:nucleotide-binding universal stress UspA family protein
MRRFTMVKDVMVHLDGTDADEFRLAAAENLGNVFEAHIIGLFLNTRPIVAVPIEDGYAATQTYLELEQRARKAGDQAEAILASKLARLGRPAEIRRSDLFADQIADVASREARSVDTFVALRPDSVGSSSTVEHLVEGVLFGSGRHVLLVSGPMPKSNFDRVLVAWNESREAARATAEAMPFLRHAREVTLMVVDRGSLENVTAHPGANVVAHLRHHGVEAGLEYTDRVDGSVSSAVIREAQRREADLIVLGGYGHSRLREWILGGTTYDLLHKAPTPLLVAH